MRSGSTSSATAARPASATAARCPRTCRRSSPSKNLVVCSVLSGNRNFEGRIQSQVRANYLASPPLVVAYALAGRMTIDLTTEPIGKDRDGKDVYLREIWPTEREIQAAMLERREVGDVSAAVRQRLRGGRALALAAGADRRSVRMGRAIDLRPQAAVRRGHQQGAGAAHRHHERARARPARRQRDDRSHLAGRIDSGGQPGREVSDRAGRQAVATSTRTARAAAITK